MVQVVTTDVERGPYPIPYPRIRTPCAQFHDPRSDRYIPHNCVPLLAYSSLYHSISASSHYSPTCTNFLVRPPHLRSYTLIISSGVAEHNEFNSPMDGHNHTCKLGLASKGLDFGELNLAYRGGHDR
jgi:hypothetical protein